MKADLKTHTRIHIKSLFDEHSLDELNTFSEEINSRLVDLLNTKKMQNIGLFSHMESEPNIQPLFEMKIGSYNFFFPRINKADEIEFVQVTSLDQLSTGKFGILEPVKELHAVDPAVLDVVLVPGLAFDGKGNRVGRGEGYYDRFLAKLPKHILKIGVSFPFQVLHEVPTEGHDQKVDVVIS